MKITVMLLLLMASMAMAANPDGRGYFEPRLIIGGGVGRSNSRLLSLPFNWELDNLDAGFTAVILQPLGDRTSLIINPYYGYARVRNLAQSVRQNLHRFGAQIGIRWYF